MGGKHKRDLRQFEADPYDDYDDDVVDDFDEFEDLTKDFYSAEWDDPAEPTRRISARRKIERRNELKDLFSEFDDGDDYELRDEW